MKINETYIENITPSRNYNWALNHYMDSGFLKSLEIEKVGSKFIINAIVDNYGQSVKLNMTIDADAGSLSGDCECIYSQYSGLCGHMAAVLMIINILEPDTFPYSGAESYEKYLENYELERQLAYEKRDAEIKIMRSERSLGLIMQNLQQNIEKMIEEDGLYYLTCEAEISSRYSSISLKYKIGQDKLYIVKNIQKFLNDVDSANIVKYGKNLSFKHSRTAFDDFSKNTIDFMKQTLVNQYNSNGYNDVRTIEITEGGIDTFFDFYYEADQQYIDLFFSIKPAKIGISINKNGDYYDIILDDYSYVCSERYVYLFNDDANFITRFDCPYNEVLAKVIGSILYGQVTKLDETTLNSLLNIASTLEPYLEIKLNFDYNKPILEEKSQLFIDFDNDNVLLKLEAIFEGNIIYNVFENSNLSLSVATESLKSLIQSLGVLKNDVVFCSIDDARVEYLIFNDLERIRSYCDIYISENVKRIAKPKKVNVSVGVQFKNGLLEIDLDSLDFDIKEIKEIMHAYKRKKKYYHLKNGDVIQLEQEAFEAVHDTFEKFQINQKDFKGNNIKLPLYRAFEIDKLEKRDGIEIVRKKSFDNLIEKIDVPAKLKIDSHYSNILRNYQKNGVQWMLKLNQYGFGGILADDMGLGKTLQMIALFESVNFKKHCLVICPAVLLYNWQAEIKKFSKVLNAVTIFGTKAQRQDKLKSIKQPSIIITTYDYIRQDIVDFEEMDFEYLVLDEAQYIKNHLTKSSKSVKLLNADHKIALTGTPIENSLAELWSIFDFLMPGYLFDYAYFQKNFERKIVKEQDQNTIDRLKQMVTPFILRRTKKEVLTDLPDKIEKVIRFQFTDQEHKHYIAKLAEINTDLRAQIGNDKINKVMILSMLTQLRQICCDTRLIYEGITQESSKLQGTMELIESMLLENKRILLFSGFTSMLSLIEKALDKKFIKYLTLTGSVSKEKRQEMVEAFQNNEAQVFLISLKAGGVGLNLTNANAVIHYDPWWNISAQNQATDRAYRIGQTEDVQVFKLIMQETIEEKILMMQERKKELSDIFVENNDGSIAKMDLKEIMSLLEI